MITEKNVSEMIEIVRAGAGLTLDASTLTVDDVVPIVTEAAKSSVTIQIRQAGGWQTKDLVRLAALGKGSVHFE